MSKDIQKRLLGIILLVIAGVLGYFEVFQRLQEAARHAPSVMYNLKVVFLVPLCFGIGLLCVIFGERVREIENSRTLRSAIILALLIGGTGLFVYWFLSTMQGYGYR